METLNNLSSTVTKALWGNAGGTDESTTQEPISGKTGDVARGQPYDAGNLPPDEQSLAQTPQPTANPTEPKYEETTTKPDLTHRASSSSSSSSSSSGSESAMPAPHKTLSSSAAPGDHSKAQLDTRDPADPAADHHASAAKRDVDDGAPGGLDVGDNPDKQFAGPGPRPLEAVAREHGGDAAGGSVPPPKQEVDKAARRDSGHEEGTGAKHVRSQGFVADGGDFDAAMPGAGREADRLLEQKGVHRDPAANGGIVVNKGADPDSAEKLSGSSSHKEKVSLKTKIKNKLHRGSHSEST